MLSQGSGKKSKPWARILPGPWAFPRASDSPKLPPQPAVLLEALEAECSAALAAKAPAFASPPAAPGDTVGGDTISESELADLALQTWRLEVRTNGMDPVDHKRIRRQLMDSVRRFKQMLERFEIEFVDPTGGPYSEGWLEVEVVNWVEPGEETPPVESGPWVEKTLSPIIRRGGRLIRSGEVVCVDRDDSWKSIDNSKD